MLYEETAPVEFQLVRGETSGPELEAVNNQQPAASVQFFVATRSVRPRARASIVYIVVSNYCRRWSLCRWMKYEERVEIGERWSKPHVSTTSLRGLQMFRDALMNKTCCVGLDQPLPIGDCQIAGDNHIVIITMMTI